MLQRCTVRLKEVRFKGFMGRRSRRPAPNTSESTGKIGQELPSNQPAPLVPLYPDSAPAQARDPRPQTPRPAARLPATAALEIPCKTAGARPPAVE